MKAFISALICGSDGKPSLVNTITAIAFMLFVLVTLYLVLIGKPWSDYAVFAGLTCGGSLAGKVGDKYMNNKPPNQAVERGKGLC